MRRGCLLLLCVVVACARASRPEHGERAHVYLVVVDGLGAGYATPERMPALSAAVASEPAHGTFFHAARAVMPARTNPNHVTLMTGVYADAHGIVGNAFWDRTRAPPQKLEAASRIEVETLFTVAEALPGHVTLGAFGKPKLARLFAGVRGRQRAPDILWSADQLPPSRRDPATGYASDADTIGAVLDATVGAEPDLVFVNLADVDRAGHAYGPDAPEYVDAIASADAALGRLVDALRARGRWARTILFVTADHGMAAVGPTAEHPHPAISLAPAFHAARFSGVTLVGDGGIEHVYLDDLPADARTMDRATAVTVADVARQVPGVVEVLARLPTACRKCPRRDVPLLGMVHPDWHLAHERTGELVVVAAPGHQFIDPVNAGDARLLGNHGGPNERLVPLVVTGGWSGLRAAPAGTPAPDLVDVAPTIAALLGLRLPRRIDGSAVADDDAGHAIAAVLARTESYSPH